MPEAFFAPGSNSRFGRICIREGGTSIAQSEVVRTNLEEFVPMIKLDLGNVLLKPSHRKQLMTWLRRSLRLGERLGNFVLSISVRRSGRAYQASASVQDRAGNFDVRSRKQDWRDAF